MKPLKILFISIAIVVLASCGPSVKTVSQRPYSEELKKSLVNLTISVGGYEQFQPWKQKNTVRINSYGCAVGPYMILTTASSIIDATLIQARRYQMNDFIPAKIKAVDYEYNLCLLELDKDSAGEPFVPLEFKDSYEKGKEFSVYWLSAGNTLTDARGVLDRAQCVNNPVSYNTLLNYILTNPSRDTSKAELVVDGRQPIGIVSSSDKDSLNVVVAEYINRFLDETQRNEYKGFGVIGFEFVSLLDPAIRKYLKMPESITHGVYVSKIYNLGTGCMELKSGDVILSVDGKSINPYGRYLHSQYDRISLDHLIGMHRCGDKIPFAIFRNGSQLNVDVEVKKFSVDDMLVPFYEYDKQPEYMVLGGYVFQKLSRDYFGLWGDNWSGKSPPHLFNYYANKSFEPSEERQDIVLLSYVLPAPINLGYQDLGRLVVSSWNGMKIKSFQDIEKARKLNPTDAFDVVEFEMNSPKLIIPRQYLEPMDKQIEQIYGIQKSKNIR